MSDAKYLKGPRRPNAPRNRTVHVRISGDDYERLEAFARKQDDTPWSLSRAARHLILVGLAAEQ